MNVKDPVDRPCTIDTADGSLVVIWRTDGRVDTADGLLRFPSLSAAIQTMFPGLRPFTIRPTTEEDTK